MTSELTVIVPTLNEAGNVRLLLSRLEDALAGIDWQVVFVDDESSDGTADTLRELSATRDRVHVIHRVNRSGLASACIDGIRESDSPYVAVIDADLQYDESLLPEMFRMLTAGEAEIVIGSRFVEPLGSAAPTTGRERLSRWARWVSKLVTRMPLSDPTSSFFMLGRDVYDEVSSRLTGRGYKILLDILATLRRPVCVSELPMRVRPRHSGESKLGLLVYIEFMALIFDKTFRGWIPVGFMLYVFVGLSGLAIHMTLLGLLFRGVGFAFTLSQTIAVIVSMTITFFLNNKVTFRDRRLSGKDAMRGLFTYYIACSLGAVINVTAATFLFDEGMFWFLAGFSGAVIGAIWNYVVNATFTWRRRQAK